MGRLTLWRHKKSHSFFLFLTLTEWCFCAEKRAIIASCIVFAAFFLLYWNRYCNFSPRRYKWVKHVQDCIRVNTYNDCDEIWIVMTIYEIRDIKGTRRGYLLWVKAANATKSQTITYKRHLSNASTINFPNQKLSATSCVIIRETLYIIIHEYTIIFGYISPIYARERHFFRYIIGNNYRR